MSETEKFDNPDEYEAGVVDTLEALLRETDYTTTQGDILLAAFDSYRIQSALVHEARERVDPPGDMETDPNGGTPER